MTLTTAAKNWLAINAGVNNCFSSTGVSYRVWNQSTNTFDTYVLGTGDAVSAFWASHSVNRDTDVIIAGMDYIGFKALNGGVNIGIPDISFAYDNDGSGTLPAYCAPQTGAAFTSTPVGASIYIDGSPTSSGATPATITGLTVGNHTYKLTYVGYVDATGSFPIVTDTVTPVNRTLIEKGSVFISSTPVGGASIYINNVIRSEVTPATITGLAPGSYTYKLRLQGYREARGTFIITPGGTTQLPVILTVEAEEAGMGLLGVALIFGTLLMGKKKEKEKEKSIYY